MCFNKLINKFKKMFTKGEEQPKLLGDDGWRIIPQPHSHIVLPWEEGTPIADAKRENRYCYLCNNIISADNYYIHSKEWDEVINPMIGPKGTISVKHHRIDYKTAKCPYCGMEWELAERTVS